MKTKGPFYNTRNLALFTAAMFVFVTFLSGCGDVESDPQSVLSLEGMNRLSPSGDMTLETLTLKKGSVIQTQGRDITIKVGHLESDEGVIQTFSPWAIADSSKNGRHGGRITIEAQSATGTLIIYGTGEDGGPGISGDPGRHGVRGVAGTPGEWGVNSQFANFNPFSTWFEFPLRLSDIPADHPHWNLKIGGEPYYVCKTHPTNGNPGGSGAFGGDGGPGGRGGDSAQVRVLVAEESNFEVKLDIRAGNAGSSGLGGEGGKGGAGGAPGARDGANRCVPARWGARGIDAPPGRPGKAGESGAELPACVRIGSKVVNCPQG